MNSFTLTTIDDKEILQDIVNEEDPFSESESDEGKPKLKGKPKLLIIDSDIDSDSEDEKSIKEIFRNKSKSSSLDSDTDSDDDTPIKKIVARLSNDSDSESDDTPTKKLVAICKKNPRQDRKKLILTAILGDILENNDENLSQKIINLYFAEKPKKDRTKLLLKYGKSDTKVSKLLPKKKRVIKLPEYVRAPNYASLYIPADTILVSKLGGEEMKIKYDGNQFINRDCGTKYETLRKATIAFTIAMNKKSIPDAWTFWKTEDNRKINRLDINPL